METIILGTQFFANLLLWIGLSLVAERAPISAFQKRFVQMTSAILLIVWFAAIYLLAENGFFLATGAIPLVLIIPFTVGFFLFFSQTFRKLLSVTPMHWIIGFQVFRVLGSLLLIGYVQGLLPGIAALPGGIGDVTTGLTAPPVAYWFYKKGKGARLIAYIWNSFGALELINALTIGILAQTPLIKSEPKAALLGILPFVLFPAFTLPHSLLLHGYTFWLLGKRRTEKGTPRSRMPMYNMSVEGAK
ncbi:hypothetical protein KSF_081680 [Reticulibacter mediterranei]|uniref:Uncharacterized protein n=1 Tax=Reticulibacter mediterranei TaxID=2778369 RepID=A0A8J3IT86_9CHLR|nr:hypothetical protein [Reticulibacter mediterranei]GHO98120.1 hypothetical protein KSF_081680 [Reticulibacter mediterranei]